MPAGFLGKTGSGTLFFSPLRTALGLVELSAYRPRSPPGPNFTGGVVSGAVGACLWAPGCDKGARGVCVGAGLPVHPPPPTRCPANNKVLKKHGPNGSVRWIWGGGGNHWAPLTCKRHIPPHPAQPQHTNRWAPRTRKRHRQEHRSQQPTESSDPTQHAKGRTGDCPGPRKGATTGRNVTQGGRIMMG